MIRRRRFTIAFGVTALLVSLLLAGQEGEATADSERLQRYRSGYLELTETLHVGRLSGVPLGTRVRVAVDPAGHLVIADSDKRRLLRYNRVTNRLESVALPSQTVAPRAVAFDSNRLFVTDPDRREVLVHENSWSVLGGLTGFDSPFEEPVDLAVGADGYLYVLDRGRREVLVFSVDGDLLRSAKIPPTVQAERAYYGLVSLAVGSNGRIYIIDGDSHGVLSVDEKGRLKAITRRLDSEPSFFAGIAVLPDGNILVTDRMSGSILEFTPDGSLAQEHVLHKDQLQKPSALAIQGRELFVVNEGTSQVIGFRLREALTGLEHAILGEEYLAVGYPDRALKELALAIQLGYESSDVHFAMGQAYYAKENYRHAIAWLEKVPNNDPHVIDALFYSGNSLAKLAAHQEAIRRYREVLDLNSGHLGAAHNLGEAYLALGDLKNAELSFRTALSISSKHFKSLLGLGRTYLAKGQYRKAEDTFGKLLATEPNRRETLYFLGLTYLRQRKSGDAIPLLEQASARGPYFTDALYHLGLGYAASGEKQKAIQQFQRVLELKPDHKEARQQLSALKKE